MKRPFADYAYSAEPIRRCHWADAVPGADLAAPTAQGDMDIDYAVIGGGYTGLNAALRLAEAGEQVVVFDAEHPGWGASGRNGGFCCLGGTRAEDETLERRHGEGAVDEVRRAEVASVDHVAGLLDRLGIDADRHSEGETILAHSEAKMRQLRAEQADYDAAYGVKTTLVEKADLRAAGLNGRFHGALTVPVGFALHPRKYLAGLAKAAEAAGARLRGRSPITRIERKSYGYQLSSPAAKIRTRKLIIATNGYSSEDVPEWMRSRFLPAQSSVIATRPMTQAELDAQGWTAHQMAYEDRRLLHYFHLTPDNRMVFGQRGGVIASAGNEARIERKVRRDFERLFPEWKHVETPDYWSGMVCLTATLTPFCGAIPEMPGAYAAFGYHGNGVAMGSYCGAMLADLARGGTAEIPRAFARPPGRFPLGPMRRGWLAAEYAFARLTNA
ncbi:NAD(P)/FAD-dependent oxidoreductase [Pseudooceanicola sp. LIPI14-2-Ac024]|uniref:NAD(P)/FAD-dependent oxidoreductase n=1 Tax=Pseudooceanicola sp. LIPI14-2-Ac024 TaxID=3344875 RepID=UPI0035CF792D